MFHRDNGAPIKDFRKAWQNACVRAGYPGRYVHDFRRTAIRNLVDAGVDRATAKAIVGHKTDEMFQRYNIRDDERLAQGVEKLADFHEAEILQVGVRVGGGKIRQMKRGSRK